VYLIVPQEAFCLSKPFSFATQIAKHAKDVLGLRKLTKSGAQARRLVAADEATHGDKAHNIVHRAMRAMEAMNTQVDLPDTTMFIYEATVHCKVRLMLAHATAYTRRMQRLTRWKGFAVSWPLPLVTGPQGKSECSDEASFKAAVTEYLGGEDGFELSVASTTVPKYFQAIATTGLLASVAPADHADVACSSA
jgi:hypothetical protein